MHEMSIAMALLDQLEQLALEHGGVRIESFTVKAGELRCIVPEALQLAFEVLADGGIAAGATMTLEIEPVLASCRVCGDRFRPQRQCYQCPECKQADVDFIEGNDIVISSMTITQQGDDGNADQCST